MNKSHPEEIITRYTQYKTITSDPQEKLSFKTQYIVQRVELKWGEIPPKLIRSGCEDPRTAWVKPDVQKIFGPVRSLAYSDSQISGQRLLNEPDTVFTYQSVISDLYKTWNTALYLSIDWSVRHLLIKTLDF